MKGAMGDSEGTKGHGGDKGTPRGCCLPKGCPLPASPWTQPQSHVAMVGETLVSPKKVVSPK